MKVKKILPVYLFLSLFLVSQSAQAWGIFRLMGIGGRGASTVSKFSKIGRVGKSSKPWSKLGKEVLITGAAGVAANEAYGYYEQYQSENGQSAPQTVLNQNYQPRTKTKPKPQERYMYVNTLEFGDPDLVW